MEQRLPNNNEPNMSASAPQQSCWHPKYWLLWFLFGLIYLITRLPLPLQHAIGRLLGFCLYWLGPRRRHIAAVNIDLCLAQLSTAERKTLLKQHFGHYGISLIESFTAWWASPATLQGRVEYEGLQHLQQALDGGNGVLLIGSHFTTLEIGVRLLNLKIPFDMMYRPHKNLLFNTVMSKGRERWGGKVIDRRDVRALLASLKNNHPLWYGPDQDYGRKHSVFVPFMGVTAATVTGTSRLAKISGAAVVPYFVERLKKSRYRIIVHPALENFPGDSTEADAETINRIIEAQIRKSPVDYLWTHRRFKTRPDGEPRPY